MRKFLFSLLLPLSLSSENLHKLYIFNYGIGYEYNFFNDFNYGFELREPLDDRRNSSGSFIVLNELDSLVYQKIKNPIFYSPDFRLTMKKNIFDISGYFIYLGVYYHKYAHSKREFQLTPIYVNALNIPIQSSTIPPISYSLYFDNTSEYGLFTGLQKNFKNNLFIGAYLDYFFYRLNNLPSRIIFFPNIVNFLYNSSYYHYTTEHFYMQSIISGRFLRFQEKNGTNGLKIIFGTHL